MSEAVRKQEGGGIPESFLTSQDGARVWDEGGGQGPHSRAGALPRDTRRPRFSSITSRYRVLWAGSRCPHSSWVKVTATSSKVTDTCQAEVAELISTRLVKMQRAHDPNYGASPEGKISAGLKGR